MFHLFILPYRYNTFETRYTIDMAKEKHPVLSVDLEIMNQAGDFVGVPLDAGNLDNQSGYSENSEQTFDGFSKLMRAIQIAHTSPEDLTDKQKTLLSVVNFRIR